METKTITDRGDGEATKQIGQEICTIIVEQELVSLPKKHCH